VDQGQLPKHLEWLDREPEVLATLVVAAGLPVNAWKWSRPLRQHDVRLPGLCLSVGSEGGCGLDVPPAQWHCQPGIASRRANCRITLLFPQKA